MKLTENQQRIYTLLQSVGPLTVKDIQATIQDIPADLIRARLNDLRKAGLVKKQKQKKLTDVNHRSAVWQAVETKQKLFVNLRNPITGHAY